MRVTSMSSRNESGIVPLGHRVLVRPILTERVVGGGIIIPDKLADKEDKAQIRAILIESGPTAWKAEGLGGIPWAKSGDVVIIGKYSGVFLKGQDDVNYRIVNDDELQARLVAQETEYEEMMP